MKRHLLFKFLAFSFFLLRVNPAFDFLVQLFVFVFLLSARLELSSNRTVCKENQENFETGKAIRKNTKQKRKTKLKAIFVI